MDRNGYEVLFMMNDVVAHPLTDLTLLATFPYYTPKLFKIIKLRNVKTL